MLIRWFGERSRMETNDNQILFINGQIPDVDFVNKNSINLMQVAAEKLQKAIIDGLIENGQKVNVVSLPFVGNYPFRFKKMYFPPYSYEKHDFLSFNNLWGYRNISRYNSLKKFLLDHKNLLNSKQILLYSPHTPFVKIAKIIKKYNPSSNICLIVPDLPQYMNLEKHKSIFYSFFKNIDITILKKNLRYIDSFVLLTKFMSTKINIYNKPELIIEGISNSSFKNKFIKTGNKKKKIVYTGKTNESFGVLSLVEAFKLIDNPNYELHIYGCGDSDDYLKKEAHNNIFFHGFVDSIKINDVIENADVLVNPRKNNETYTKYSFPSKLMDYIATGRPIVCYKLDGIPDEYNEVLFYPKGNTNQDLADKIVFALTLDEASLIRHFNISKKFIKNKNSFFSIKKLIEFLDKSKDVDRL